MNPRLLVKEQSKDHFYHPDFDGDCQATPIPCKSPFQGKTHDVAGGPLNPPQTFRFPTRCSWNIRQTPKQQFMKEFLTIWSFGNAWGMLHGYVEVLWDNRYDLMVSNSGMISPRTSPIRGGVMFSFLLQSIFCIKERGASVTHPMSMYLSINLGIKHDTS